MIPVEMPYKDQLNLVKAQTAQAGIDRVHGLGHRHARTRYAELRNCNAAADEVKPG